MASEPALPPKTVPGLGFKNAAAAQRTLRALRGRDPFYQRMVLSGLMSTAKQVLRLTRKDRKKANILAALAVFDKFLEDFHSRRAIKQNCPYLPLDTVRRAEELAGDNVTEQQKAFIAAYSSVRGEYQRLRNVRAQHEDSTWDIVRNRELKPLKRKLARADLFDEDGELTEEHVEMILWAYSPDRKALSEYFRTPREQRERCREIENEAQVVGSDTDEQSDGERRSKRTTTKAISKVKEAIATLERSLHQLKARAAIRSSPYLPLDAVRKAAELVGDNITEQQKAFVAAYSAAGGDRRGLGNMRAHGEDYIWEYVRNRELSLLRDKYADARLFTADRAPTPEHMEMLLWAYSPKPKRVAKLLLAKKKGEKESESHTNDKSESEKSSKRQTSSENNDEGDGMLRRSKRIKK